MMVTAAAAQPNNNNNRYLCIIVAYNDYCKVDDLFDLILSHYYIRVSRQLNL